MLVIGIDPGAKYTGVSVRNIAEDTILLSSTYVKPDETEIFTWATEVAQLIAEEVVSQFPDAKIGIEGISDPKGYKNGKLSPLNPKWVIRLGIVAGAIANEFRDVAVIIPPGKNGSSQAGYPDVLNGRRPASLPGKSKGAGTRNHEKSAYDVAGEIPFVAGNNYKLDSKSEL